jgi:hypothetical protein
MEVSGQLHAPATLLHDKEPPGTHWIRGWVDPSGGLDAMAMKKKIPAPAGNRTPVVQPAA